jgi:hypothetical protein
MSNFNIRKLLFLSLIVSWIGAAGTIASLTISGRLKAFLRLISNRDILTPMLLVIMSAGGVAVFALMFVNGSIHEDVLWIKTLELLTPLFVGVYAIWCLVLELRKFK